MLPEADSVGLTSRFPHVELAHTSARRDADAPPGRPSWDSKPSESLFERASTVARHLLLR